MNKNESVAAKAAMARLVSMMTPFKFVRSERAKRREGSESGWSQPVRLPLHAIDLILATVVYRNCLELAYN